LDVCGKCARHGRKVDTWQPVSSKIAPRPVKLTTKVAASRSFVLDELVEDYGKTIRNARIRKNLSIEELAGRIMERVALLRKIEREELPPEDKVIKKLEQVLEIKLTERVTGEGQKVHGFSRGTTLGDIAIIKKKS